jgi:hypothetical protein
MESRTTTETLDDSLMLIDWVNTIDVPSCLLVNDIEDLRDGVAICDIIANLRGEAPWKSVIRRNVGR